MSNPLDSLIETLQTSEPRPEAVDRAVTAYAKPTPVYRPRLVPLATGVAALSLIALWPRGTAGMAWAQIAAQTPPLRYILRVDRVQNGKAKLLYETKVDNATNSYRMSHMSPTGATVSAKGKDGHYWPLDSEFVSGPFGRYMRFNGIATFTRKPPKANMLHEGWGRSLDLDLMLNRKGVRQLSVDRDVETRVGHADHFHLDQPGQDPATRIPFEVYVQPGTKKILGWDVPERDAVCQTTVTYPDHFDSSDWALPTKAKAPTYDLDAIDAWARERLKTPIAPLNTGGANSQLRFVVQGAHHELWLIWSGAKPNGDLKDKASVLGIKNGLCYGLAEFAAKPGATSKFSYGGHAISLDHKVDRVDLKVPVFAKTSGRSKLAGYVLVRNVAVKQVSGIDALWGALAVSQPIR